MYDYRDKFKGRDGRRSIYEILSVTTFENYELIKNEYDATEISQIKIDGNTFNNYGQYQFVWEKSYVTSPERSSGGNLGNLNAHSTFLTAHLLINFSLMSIDDYRAIMKLHYERNEFVVECYDIIYNRPIKIKMYFGTEEMAKLYTINKMRLGDNEEWEDWIALVGVQDYSVELIGTNNELDLVSVEYLYNSDITPNDVPVPPQYEEDVYIGEEIVIGANSTFPSMPPNPNLKFKEWQDESGEIYTNGIVVTVNSPIKLKAIWESKTSFNLSFNYGLSDVATEINPETGEATQILNKEITNIQNIGTLPPITVPFVEDKNTKEKYYPYENGGWYKHPVKQENMKVESGIPYWATRDTIIYALYDKKKFAVEYETNDPNTSIPNQIFTYEDVVWLPNLSRNGYMFEGWYIDNKFNTRFSGNMPPYKLNLYAKWIKK
jgi:uncharacterized repeat protein (TIGR02543 family)